MARALRICVCLGQRVGEMMLPQSMRAIISLLPPLQDVLGQLLIFCIQVAEGHCQKQPLDELPHRDAELLTSARVLLLAVLPHASNVNTHKKPRLREIKSHKPPVRPCLIDLGDQHFCQTKPVTYLSFLSLPQTQAI